VDKDKDKKVKKAKVKFKYNKETNEAKVKMAKSFKEAMYATKRTKPKEETMEDFVQRRNKGKYALKDLWR
jgi:hypothetical protein